MKKETEKPKRKKNPSPTHLCLKFLRERGMPAAVVEKWMKTPQGGFRKDTFGADIQCLTKDAIIGIQAGADAHHKNKVEHAIKHPHVRLWLQSPSRKFHVWTFGLRAAYNINGDRRKKDKWVPRVTEIYMSETGKILSRPFSLVGAD